MGRVEVSPPWQGTGRHCGPLSPEIKGSLSSLPLYRHWLQNTKLPAYSREGTDAARDGGARALGKGGAWPSGSPPPTPPCLCFQLSARLPAVSRKGKSSEDAGIWGARGEPGCCGGNRGGGGGNSGRQSRGFPRPSSFPLCPAGGSTVVYNCSTCQELDVCCWPRKRCLPGSTPPPGLPWLRSPSSRPPTLPPTPPTLRRLERSPGPLLLPGFPAGSHDLWEARVLLLALLVAAFLLGVLSLLVE